MNDVQWLAKGIKMMQLNMMFLTESPICVLVLVVVSNMKSDETTNATVEVG